MGRQVFTAGEILTAASMNDLGDATVMVFDDATARATAIPTPVEGMTTYLKDTDLVEVFDGSDFVPVAIEPDPPAILQVVSTTLSTVFTTASGSYVDVTGLAATITPTSTFSKVLVQVRLAIAASVAVSTAFGQVVRDSTPIGGGAAAGSRQSGAFYHRSASNLNNMSPHVFIHLDEPSSTSAITYKVQVAGEANTRINTPNGADTDNVNHPRLASTITLMEVAG